MIPNRLPRLRRAARLLALAPLLLAAGCQGRPRAETDESAPKLTASGHVAVVDLTRGAPESTAEGGLFPLPAPQTFVGLVRTLQSLSSDRDATAVFVTLGEARLGFAQSAEIGRLLAAVRDAGKSVVCHTHQIDNSSSWLLQHGCSEIWLSPAGDASTVGIAAQLSYLKGTFDRLGIEADMLAMGRYKSGAEPLTREGPSEPSAENLTATLRSIRDAWLDAVGKARQGRGATDAERQELLDALEDGPWTPTAARERKIADRVVFPDEALGAAKAAGRVDTEKVVFGRGAENGKAVGLAEIIRVLSGADRRSGGRPRIAVVPAVGSITMTSEGLLSEGITARATVRTLARLREDPAVKAVVVRMDSPGGSPLASDLIWREIMRLRKEKPVIASVGGMAASGGYYIVAAANEIVAERSSIVGSIGVFGGKLVLEQALSNVGIQSVVFPASPAPGAAARAAYLSPLVPWDDATRDKVRAQMESIYELFLARVAEGRGMDVEKVRASAEGAIFTATTGKERGLVDELGGLARALERARELGKVDADAPVVVEGPADNLLEVLLLGEGAEASEVEEALARFRERQAARLAGIPQWEQLRPFAAAIAPLLTGEPVVAALPYAIDVR
ncbi:MAG: signal peptide peptidase SppA [Myxococcales bacterium]|nr:signal peptide peptidase SppA [Myxococcales bacterium]